MLDEITTHLKTSHQAEIEFHAQKVKELNKQKENCKSKLNKLVDMVLNNLITEEIYNTKKEEIEKELKSCIVEIEMHDNADTDFKQALTTAFYLTSKSYDLFICSHTKCGEAKHEEKRRLINFVFSKLELKGKTLGYTLRCPFDIMVKMNHSKDWLPGRDSNPRPID